MVVGQPVKGLGNYSDVRLVSAGFRLWKTSQSTTESGKITALYSKRHTIVE